MEIVLVITGIVVGALLGWLITKGKMAAVVAKCELMGNDINRLNAELDAEKRKNEALQAERANLISARDTSHQETEAVKQKVGELQDEIAHLKSEYAASKQSLTDDFEKRIDSIKMEFSQEKQSLVDGYEKRLAERKNELELTYNRHLEDEKTAHAQALDALESKHREAIYAQEVRFKDAIETLKLQLSESTNEMLKARQNEFASTSRTNINDIVSPLKDAMDKMKEALEKNNEKNSSMGDILKENIEKLALQTQAAKASAESLANALRHQTKAQGDWGETVLTELLESQGLTEGVHFETQMVIRDNAGKVVKPEDGSSLRPDVVLHLDQVRELIIDAKVSLSAFLDYVNAEDDATRAEALKRHIVSITSHVDELAKKRYTDYIQPPKVAMDYVIMFVPNTGALWTALKEQPDLWRKSMEKGVYIADEQTLYAALRIVSMTWTQIRQGETHNEVFRLADELLDRVNKFFNAHEAMGVELKKMQESYNTANNIITEGGQSIVTSAAKLKRLGAKVKNKENKLLKDVAEVEQLPSSDVDSSMYKTIL